MTPASDRPAHNLFGLDRDALSEIASAHGAPPYHGKQIYRWLYARRVFEPGEWTDLPRALRRTLADTTRVDPGRIDARTVASDGTIKYRIALPEGGAAEAVHMVQRGRVTLCLSTQVGCALDCDFCLTGKMGLDRHMTVGEIAGQVALIHEDQGLEETSFNLVFMGMGEPLHNYDRTLAAFRILADPDGFGVSRRRITVSTVGIAPAIEKLAGEPRRPKLAVSLNATTDQVRDRIMPINRKYPIERLLQACRSFARKTGEKLTFEYVLMRGVNDSDADVSRLARILGSCRAKLNLIPFNPVPGRLPYEPVSKERVAEIRDRLLERKLPVSIRWSRGVEARAACGQLALERKDGGRRTRRRR
jgi:23S rRNA (adenine2503-C2)-methyltransferase